MKVDLNAPLLDRKGQPIVEAGETVTLRQAVYLVLDTVLPDDAQAGAGAKLRLSMIGFKVAAAEQTLDLSAGDVTLILERAARLTSALVYGQMVAALDPTLLEAQ